MFTIQKQKQNSANVNKKKSLWKKKKKIKKKGNDNNKWKKIHSNKSSQFKHLRQGPVCAVTPKTYSQRCAA